MDSDIWHHIRRPQILCQMPESMSPIIPWPIHTWRFTLSATLYSMPSGYEHSICKALNTSLSFHFKFKVNQVSQKTAWEGSKCSSWDKVQQVMMLQGHLPGFCLLAWGCYSCGRMVGPTVSLLFLCNRWGDYADVIPWTGWCSLHASPRGVKNTQKCRIFRQITHKYNNYFKSIA